MGHKVVAIHQPNFFPWLGYFNKVARADVFIMHDNVQFPRTGGGTWVNRVRILVKGAPAWLTMPVRRSRVGSQLIHEVRINEQAAWRRKCLDTLRHSYRRAPHFTAVYPFLEALFQYQTDRVADFNTHALRTVLDKLQMPSVTIESGTTLGLQGKGTDLLIAMVKAVGGDTYMCGGGASGYQEDEKFEAAGLGLFHQDFHQAEYQQAGAKEFAPGLSIIDALMNCGFEGTEALVRGKVTQPVPTT